MAAGNALAVDQAMPFTSLTRFGTEFLNKFQASVCKSPTLEKVRRGRVVVAIIIMMTRRRRRRMARGPGSLRVP